MASKTELEMWAKRDAVEAEWNELMKKAAPLKENREALCVQRNKLNEEANALSEQINKILQPRIVELGKERSMFSRALSGKTRPQPEPKKAPKE